MASCRTFGEGLNVFVLGFEFVNHTSGAESMWAHIHIYVRRNREYVSEVLKWPQHVFCLSNPTMKPLQNGPKWQDGNAVLQQKSENVISVAPPRIAPVRPRAKSKTSPRCDPASCIWIASYPSLSCKVFRSLTHQWNVLQRRRQQRNADPCTHNCQTWGIMYSCLRLVMLICISASIRSSWSLLIWNAAVGNIYVARCGRTCTLIVKHHDFESTLWILKHTVGPINYSSKFVIIRIRPN